MSGTLNGNAIARGLVQIGSWGLPWADVELATELELADGEIVSLVVGEVPMSMAVVSGGAYQGKSAYRLVGGRGRWGRTVDAKSYGNDNGMAVSKVLADLAAAVGETVADLPTTTLGPHYARANVPAYLTLGLVVGQSWYVDLAGVTRFGARPVTTYAGTAARTRVDPLAQVVELAVEGSAAGLLPGVTVDGYGPATDVEFELGPDRMTARIWAGPALTSRRLAAYSKIIAPHIARMRYLGPTEFRVVTQVGDRLNLQVVRKSTGFGDLAAVHMRPGIAGWKGDVLPGSLVLVWFVDGDPSRPVVVAHDAPGSPGWMPLTFDLGGPGALPLAYQGSVVVAGPFGGTVTVGSTRGKVAPT